MNERISQLVAQMAELEDELRAAVHQQESRIFFQINGKRVEFEKSVRTAHRKLKKNVFRWLVTNRPQNLITGPIIFFAPLSMPTRYWVRTRVTSIFYTTVMVQIMTKNWKPIG